MSVVLNLSYTHTKPVGVTTTMLLVSSWNHKSDMKGKKESSLSEVSSLTQVRLLTLSSGERESR